MKHARSDYARFGLDPALQDESLLSPGSTAIGPEEPVFLLRAKDKYMVPMLERYHELISADAAVPNAMKNAVQMHIHDTQYWQARNAVLSPTMPDSTLTGGVAVTVIDEAAEAIPTVAYVPSEPEVETQVTEPVTERDDFTNESYPVTEPAPEPVTPQETAPEPEEAQESAQTANPGDSEVLSTPAEE